MHPIETLTLLKFFHHYTIGLCLGVSTIILTFYFYIVAWGHIEKPALKMMQIVVKVLRIGMVLIVIAELATLLYHFQSGLASYWLDNPSLYARLTIFTIIVVNAAAMQTKKISMWVGPVLAGGSWYSYFFINAWPHISANYFAVMCSYLVWLAVFGALLTGLRIYLTPRPQHQLAENSAAAS